MGAVANDARVAHCALANTHSVLQSSPTRGSFIQNALLGGDPNFAPPTPSPPPPLACAPLLRARAAPRTPPWRHRWTHWRRSSRSWRRCARQRPGCRSLISLPPLARCLPTTPVACPPSRPPSRPPTPPHAAARCGRGPPRGGGAGAGPAAHVAGRRRGRGGARGGAGAARHGGGAAGAGGGAAGRGRPAAGKNGWSGRRERRAPNRCQMGGRAVGPAQESSRRRPRLHPLSSPSTG